MAITLRGHAHPLPAGSTGTSIAVSSTAISGLAANDVVFIGFYVDQNNTSITAPSGWTLIDNLNNSGGPYNQVEYYHVYTASEPASWTWTLGASVFYDYELIAFTGCNTTTPLDAHSIVNSATATSITYTGADAIVLFNINYSGTSIAASGYTIVENGDGLGLGYVIETSSGSLGATVTGGGGATTTGLIALKPAGAAGTSWNQAVSDSHSGGDILAKAAQKYRGETTSAVDVLTKTVVRRVGDSFSQLDVLAKMPAKTFLDLFSALDTANASKAAGGAAWQKNISDAHSALDVLRRTSTKLSADQWSSVDAVTRVWVAHLLLVEVFSAVDVLTKQVTHTTNEATSSRDTLQTMRGALLTVLESLSSTDAQQRLIQHLVAETTSSQDSLLKQVRHSVTDTLSQTDRVTAGRTLLLLILDALSQQDGVQPTLFTSSGRKTLAMVTSLVASSLGIHIVLLSPLLGAQLSASSTLGSTGTVLPPLFRATTTQSGPLSATASIL